MQLKKSILTKHKRVESSIKNVVRGYTLRTFIIPHLLVIGTFLTGHFGGMMSVQTNAVRRSLYNIDRSIIDQSDDFLRT